MWSPPAGLTDAKIDKLLTRHLIFQSARLGNSYLISTGALPTFESIRFFRLWSAVRRLIICHFQFNVCLNLTPFSFQQFLCIKYTTRLRSKYLCQVNLISKNIYFDKRLHTFLSIVDIYGNGRFTLQSWFIAIAHYLTF